MERDSRGPAKRPPPNPKKRKSRLPQILLLLSVITVLQLIIIMLLMFNIDNRIDTAVRTALGEHFEGQFFTGQSEAGIREALETTVVADEPANTVEIDLFEDENDENEYSENSPNRYEDNEEDYYDYYEQEEHNYDVEEEQQEDDYTEYAANNVLEIPQLFIGSPYFEPYLPPLFNPWNPIPDDFHLELVSVGNHQVHAKAAPALQSMMQAARNDSITLTILSAHRSNARQAANFNAAVNRRISNYGMTYAEARTATARAIAVPGTSEHETGLAIDFNWIDVRFDQRPEFRWLMDNSAYFGFILRYKQETEHITGIMYEPWHFRYIGINHAKKMRELGIATLEEYLALFDIDYHFHHLQ